MTVSPLVGNALATEFTITVDGFKDANLPLFYQYMIYNCPGSY